MLSWVLTAALAAQAAAAEPSGGAAPTQAEGNTPLQRQLNGSPAAPVGRSWAAPLPTATPPQPDAALGQAASGVASYPASFFAASQSNTAREMLDRVPGFVFDAGSADLRGLASSGGNVLIDGRRPASKSDDLESVLKRIPASRVERIDLIRGGAPGIDMQGKTVVANVIRKTGAATTGVAALGTEWHIRDGRQAPQLRLELTRTGNDRSLELGLIAAGYFDDGAGDGSRILRAPSGTVLARAQDKTEGDGDQYSVTGAYEQPLVGGRLRLNGQLFVQRYFFDERVEPEFGADLLPAQTERDDQNKEKAEVGARYTRDFGKALGLELTFLDTLQGEDYRSLFSQPGEDDRFREQHTSNESIGRATFTWRRSPTLTFEFGGEGAYNILWSHTSFRVNGAPLVLPAANVLVHELRGEGFGQFTWRPTPKLTIEGGLRVEASQIGSERDVTLDKTLVFPKPRLTLAWSPTKADQFRFRVEREVGQLDFNDFVASSSLSTGQILAGNPDLNPQQAWVVEAAYERAFWTSGAAVITLRHSELEDVIDRAPVLSPSGVFDSPANIGSGTKDELIASLTLPLGPFWIRNGLLKATSTWRSSSVTDPTTGMERGITKLRPLEAQIDFTQDLPAHHIRWGMSLFGGFRERYYRFNQIETDTFTPVFSAFAEWKPKPDLGLRVEMDDAGARYQRGVQTYPGVRGATSLLYTDVRDLRFGPFFYFRARKTF